MPEPAPTGIVGGSQSGGASAILYATVIIVLVFIPLFALPGLEGKLFVPLGIAFIVSTLASLIVSVTVTPVLSFYLLPQMKNLDHGDTKVLAWLKARQPAAAAGRLGSAQGLPWQPRVPRCWWPRWRCRSSRRPSCRPSTRARC